MMGGFRDLFRFLWHWLDAPGIGYPTSIVFTGTLSNDLTFDGEFASPLTFTGSLDNDLTFTGSL